MTVWVVITILAGLAALWMARPFIRTSAIELNEAESSISIFRDQLDEIDRDSESGQISAEEAEAAKEEVEGRVLAAAKALGGGLSVSRRSPAGAVVIAALVIAASVGTYMLLGKSPAGRSARWRNGAPTC